MEKNQYRKFAAVILAAGKGTRMKSDLPKVLHTVNGKTLLSLVLEKIEKLHVGKIITIVKHQKELIIPSLPEYSYFAEQGEEYGTAKAVEAALPFLPINAKHIMVINGDDSMFYSLDTFKCVMQKHLDTKSDITFITLTKENPTGYGRVVYDKRGKFKEIVEEKDATDEIRMIKEVNDGVYIFKKDFLLKNITSITPSTTTGEYYLTDLISLAVSQNKKVSTSLLADSTEFFGISTQDDVRLANELSQQINPAI